MIKPEVLKQQILLKDIDAAGLNKIAKHSQTGLH